MVFLDKIKNLTKTSKSQKLDLIPECLDEDNQIVEDYLETELDEIAKDGVLTDEKKLLEDQHIEDPDYNYRSAWSFDKPNSNNTVITDQEDINDFSDTDEQVEQLLNLLANEIVNNDDFLSQIADALAIQIHQQSKQNTNLMQDTFDVANYVQEFIANITPVLENELSKIKIFDERKQYENE